MRRKPKEVVSLNGFAGGWTNKGDCTEVAKYVGSLKEDKIYF